MTLPWTSCRIENAAAHVVGGGGFSPTSTESSNFLARTSGLNNTHKTRYDALISGLVTDGDYTKLDVLYVWATDTTTNALLNLAPNASYNGTVVGTPTSFTADVGYTGDGSTFAIDSHFNPNTASSPQYTQNSASLGAYVLTNVTSGGSIISVVGAQVGAADAGFGPFYFGTALYKVNEYTTKSPSTSTSQGQWIATRTAASGAGSTSVYLNGNTTAFDTDTVASTGVPNTNFYFFSSNNGAVSNASAAQMSAGFIGSGLSSPRWLA